MFYTEKTNFFVNDMQIEKFKSQIDSDITFKRCFSKNLTIPFKDEINRRVKDVKLENHTILFIAGETGIGKSRTGITIANDYDKDFTTENIFYDNKDILENLHKFKAGNFIMRDESPERFGLGSSRIESNMNLVLETLRKSGINFILIGAYDRDILTAHWYLEVLQNDKTNIVNRIGIKDNKEKKYLGYCNLKLIDENHKLWIDYSKKKDEFMQRVKENEIFSSNPFGIIKKINNLDMLQNLKKNERMVFLRRQFPNITLGELNEINTILKLYFNGVYKNEYEEKV